jgi:hypothetical protein
VAAAIDKGNNVIEANEGNNSLIKNLGPASAGVKPKPNHSNLFSNEN